MIFETLSNPSVLRAGTVPKLPVFGVDVEVLLDAKASRGASAVYRVTAEPGTGAPLHRHTREDEMFHVLAGEFDVVCGDATHRMLPGDFAWAPRGVAHAFMSAGTTTGKILIFSTPAGHEVFFRDCADAVASGTFNPETGAAICQKHGIELLG
jgi:quercetin dioxygenase-like cupin family protein